MAVVLIIVTTWIAYVTAPGPARARTAEQMGVDLGNEAVEFSGNQGAGEDAAGRMA